MIPAHQPDVSSSTGGVLRCDREGGRGSVRVPTSGLVLSHGQMTPATKHLVVALNKCRHSDSCVSLPKQPISSRVVATSSASVKKPPRTDTAPGAMVEGDSVNESHIDRTVTFS